MHSGRNQPNLRLFTGDSGNHLREKEAIPSNDLQRPTPHSIAQDFIKQLDFRGKVTSAHSPEGIGVHELVSALNQRWRSTHPHSDLISEQTLRKILPLSPVHLQKCSGEYLKFEVALSEGGTEGKNFKTQQRSLANDQLGVADPASTAIMIAALLIKAAEEGKGHWRRHLEGVAFRTQAVDPVEGYALPTNDVIRYDVAKQQIVHQTREHSLQDDSLWCAGSPSTFRPKRAGLDILGWVLGR